MIQPISNTFWKQSTLILRQHPQIHPSNTTGSKHSLTLNRGIPTSNKKCANKPRIKNLRHTVTAVRPFNPLLFFPLSLCKMNFGIFLLRPNPTTPQNLMLV